MDIVLANELVPDRARLYSSLHPTAKMVCGDISEASVFDEIVESSPSKVDFLIATPPCQGMSVAGKNRSQDQMVQDCRNFLVFKVVDYVSLKRPDYVLMENVPNFFKIKLPFDGNLRTIPEVMRMSFGGWYDIDYAVYDTAEYGVPQRRTRAILRMHKKGLEWGNPQKSEQVTVRDAIGYLPSLEAGEKSSIKWHFARKHSPAQVECMRHTPTGHSAMENGQYYPKNSRGERLKGYNTTYRRILWDEPSPTITIRNDAISSQLNVHPGRPLKNGTYSDARVLTPLELMLLTSLPYDWNIPDDTPELLIRRCLGECIPPLFIKQIVSKIGGRA